MQRTEAIRIAIMYMRVQKARREIERIQFPDMPKVLMEILEDDIKQLEDAIEILEREY